MIFWKRSNVNHFEKNWQMSHPQAEVFWQIPHCQDREDDKFLTNAQGGGRNGHTWNWLCHYHYNLRQIFFLLIGKEPSTWPANNCLQIMVCSCATSSNCVWLWHLAANNILLIHKRNHAFRTPRVKMADHFASRGYTRWSNDKTIIELSYRKISWFVTV